MQHCPAIPLTGALFDPTYTYRYALWRIWDRHTPRVAFIMLNPSTADGESNDPTIRRCVQFAQTWGYGSLEVVNLFAYRATSPMLLQQALDPVGTENDRYLLATVERSDRIVLAWGNKGRWRGRDRAILTLLASQNNLYCLGTTQSGQPRHPLYLKGNTSLRQMALN